MSASITINPSEIQQQISQAHTISSSKLRSIAQKAEGLATAVKK